MMGLPNLGLYGYAQYTAGNAFYYASAAAGTRAGATVLGALEVTSLLGYFSDPAGVAQDVSMTGGSNPLSLPFAGVKRFGQSAIKFLGKSKTVRNSSMALMLSFSKIRGLTNKAARPGIVSKINSIDDFMDEAASIVAKRRAGSGLTAGADDLYAMQRSELFPGHIMSPVDPPLSAPPIVIEGPFTSAQRDLFLKGKATGTKIAPHHRHQLSVERHGGVIDEIPGPGHPSGNIHTKLVNGLNRHPGPSYFNSVDDGSTLRSREIYNHWKAKGQRLIPDPDNTGMWLDPN